VRAVRLLVPAALLAAGCSAQPLPTTTTPPTTATTLPVTTTSIAGPADTTSTAEPSADAARLAAIVLFPEDLPTAYASLPLDPAGSGFRPAGASLSSALEPEDEADDIVRFGLLGDFVATYGSTTGLWIAIEAGAFIDPAGAAGYLADWQEDLARGAAEYGSDGSDLSSFLPATDPTAADEAVRARYTLTYNEPGRPELEGVVRVVRAGATLAWVWVVGNDPAAAVDVLAPLVEDRLLGVLAGALPARDPAVLGLTPAPTELLDSFTFEYSYGIDTTADQAGFRIEATGEFQGPDRTSCRLAYTAGDEEEVLARLVAIGTRVWLEGITGYQEVPLRHPSALSDLPLCPGHPLFWEDTGYHRLPETAGTPGTVDEIAVLRSDLATDPAALEALGYSPARAARITRYEIARAVDEGWVVELHIEEETNLAEARDLFGLPSLPGAEALPATIFTSLQLSRPNDLSVAVEPPLTAG
jgi:hypothetical protein